MSPLLIKPAHGAADGRVHHITPASAGWSYVGFEVFDLAPGQALAQATEGREACLVLLSGRAEVSAGGQDFGTLGERSSPFEGAPWSVYVPARSRWRVVATTPVELAVCSSPAEGRLPARLIPPGDVGQETRGKGTNTRYVRNILPDSAAAETLLVVEVVTPGGNWSSYPPHKHDTDAPPRETYLEETYYHRLARPGFAVQRVYTDDLSLDETMAVADRDVVLVPRGYHPVGAPIGFDLYYLNTMAGPVRQWHFTLAPEHAFLGW
jgi:5-deoxy-glucuronate isomerase